MDRKTMLHAVLAAACVFSFFASGCFNDEINGANQQRLARQQVELQQLKQEVSAIQAQRSSYSTPPLPAGACDVGIMQEATRKGRERLAASDFSGALNYYQDAVSACPGNAQAHLNLGRAYEALGERAQALAQYRIAASSNESPADADAVRNAHGALSRLGG